MLPREVLEIRMKEDYANVDSITAIVAIWNAMPQVDEATTLENKITPKTFNEICNAVFIGLYLNYDINKDFDSQFEYNTNKITEILNTITTLSKKILK